MRTWLLTSEGTDMMEWSRFVIVSRPICVRNLLYDMKACGLKE